MMYEGRLSEVFSLLLLLLFFKKKEEERKQAAKKLLFLSWLASIFFLVKISYDCFY